MTGYYYKASGLGTTALNRFDTDARGNKRDIAQDITDLIIAKIEQGVLPWRRPWRTFGAGGRPLRAGGQAYTGINSILLWAIADGSDYQV